MIQTVIASKSSIASYASEAGSASHASSMKGRNK